MADDAHFVARELGETVQLQNVLMPDNDGELAQRRDRKTRAVRSSNATRCVSRRA
jgi:hypothetical protein